MTAPETSGPCTVPPEQGPDLDPKAAALFLVKAKVFKVWLKEEEDRAREVILASTDEGDRVTATVTMPDGTRKKVGGVTAKVATPAGTKAVVTDEQAFTAWCKTHLPHAIVEQVRSTDRDVLLKEVLTYGGKLDVADGTVTAIAGVEVVPTAPGERGAMVTQEKDAGDTLRAAFGTLALTA